jgi:hypothetical protein
MWMNEWQMSAGRVARRKKQTIFARVVRDLDGMGEMLGASPAMKDLFESLKRVAARMPRF